LHKGSKQGKVGKHMKRLLREVITKGISKVLIWAEHITPQRVDVASI
jgi:hypothetical protein